MLPTPGRRNGGVRASPQRGRALDPVGRPAVALFVRERVRVPWDRARAAPSRALRVALAGRDREPKPGGTSAPDGGKATHRVGRSKVAANARRFSASGW